MTKGIKNFILTFFLGVILVSCSKDESKILRQAEEVLPGIWHIKSLKLPKNGSGITYHGNTFISDTTLFDIGSIDITDFRSQDLNTENLSEPKVICELKIDAESFPISINRMFVNQDEELFTYFRFNGPDGIHPIDTPGKEFFWSSFIFNDNYIIDIIDSKNVEIMKVDDRDAYVMSLTK